MQSVRKFFIVIVINLFLMYAVTVLYEYINLSERFEALDNTVSLSLESAIDMSINSEELFNSDDHNVTSHGQAELKTWVFCSNGDSIRANPYAYAMRFWETSSHFSNITSASLVIANTNLLHNADHELTTTSIWSFLYGNPGIDYSSLTLTWKGLDNKSKQAYLSRVNDPSLYEIYKYGGTSSSGLVADKTALSLGITDRTANPEFLNFYKNVGKYVLIEGNVREKDGTDNFKVATKSYPTLWNMGLNFTNSSLADTTVAATVWSNNYSLQDWDAVPKLGPNGSQYYLSPNSLGVTYIPLKMLYPTMVNTLTTQVVCNKLGGGNGLNLNDTAAIKEAFGCIAEDNVEYTHQNAAHTIINDGNVEYFLDTLNIDVTYMAIDFTNYAVPSMGTKQAELLSRLNQCVEWTTGTSYTNYVKTNAQKVMNHLPADSSKNVRIVAKITAQISVAIPYQCDLLKYSARHWTAPATDNHFGLRPYNAATGTFDNDGYVTYEYTTYRMTY